MRHACCACVCANQALNQCPEHNSLDEIKSQLLIIGRHRVLLRYFKYRGLARRQIVCLYGIWVCVTEVSASAHIHTHTHTHTCARFNTKTLLEMKLVVDCMRLMWLPIILVKHIWNFSADNFELPHLWLVHTRTRAQTLTDTYGTTNTQPLNVHGTMFTRELAWCFGFDCAIMVAFLHGCGFRLCAPCFSYVSNCFGQ